jgi:disulfide bond formation protein DsbB
MSASPVTWASRRAPVLIFLVAIAVLGTALASQYLGGLQPCELCLYERWPYDAIAIVMLLAMLSRNASLARAALALSTLIFLGSSVLAAYHVGVEQHWIEGPTACTGDIGNASSPDALLQALQGRQPVQCDVVQWSFHGLSLAGLNLVVSLALLAFSLWATMQTRADVRS